MTLNKLLDAVPKTVLPFPLVRRQYINACVAVVEESKKALTNNFEVLCAVDRLVTWEQEYARRGYKTVSPDVVAFWHDHDLLDALVHRLPEGNKPYFYARTYSPFAEIPHGRKPSK